MTRSITYHHDGHGLNDQTHITSDELDPNAGGAAHAYRIDLARPFPAPMRGIQYIQCGSVDFQHGPRDEPGSVAGATDQALLAIVIDRYECFQAGPFACESNARALNHMRAALAEMKDRADERAARHVLGKNLV